MEHRSADGHRWSARCPSTILRIFDKDRVNTAIVNSGFEMPKERLTINLAPADIKKEGPIFDLPIALGVLATMGEELFFYSQKVVTL